MSGTMTMRKESQSHQLGFQIWKWLNSISGVSTGYYVQVLILTLVAQDCKFNKCVQSSYLK